MTDPIGYLFQNIVNPKLNVIMLMLMIIGLVLIILLIITNFINNEKLLTQLIDVQDKITVLIEKKNI